MALPGPARHLVWIRNDPRLDDNPALAQACSAGPTEVVFCSTPAQWQQHHESPAKLGLHADALKQFQQQLNNRGIYFTHLKLQWFNEVPEALLELMQVRKLNHLWFNQELPLNEYRRDAVTSQLLQAEGFEVHSCAPDLLLPQAVFNKQGAPFRVFTPFFKSWLQQLDPHALSPSPEPVPQGKPVQQPIVETPWAGAYREDLWPPAEQQAQQHLADFCQDRMFAYPQRRDFPAQPGTSTVSPWLSTGVLGPRRCLASLLFHCEISGRDWRESDWLRELAWRDFYRQLIWHFPRLSMGNAFQQDTDRIEWRDNPEGYAAWCNGQTGFPIVDAAMKQLRQTGWMHNRLRMVSASFLTKLLFLDWRKGEQFFMENLVDGDFASNNGGWQWSASTGCDAAPYFRVFNPTRQSERFDPDGAFIRRFIPELADVDKKQIHCPSEQIRKDTGYPLPVIDYRTARQYAIDSFKANRKSQQD